jgi:SAM-dependent methyltransferase
MVELLDPRPGETLLELGAGIGETGFLAAERLGPSGRLLSSDAAPEMVEAARRRAGELGVDNVVFRVIDAAAIELDADSVDGVLCRFGYMLVPDVERAFRETARVLRPGGRVALAVWAEPERNDWITAANRSALALGFLERPDPDEPGPFRLADPMRLQELIAGAGLDLAVLEEMSVQLRAASLEEWWETTRDMSRMLTELLERVGPRDEDAIRRAAEERLAVYVGSDGSVSVPGVTRVALAAAPG